MLIILLLLAGGVSTSKVMQSYVSQHERVLYQIRGPLSGITNEGNGGRILIYSSSVYQG